MPKVISAKIVPARRVVTEPKRTPQASPAAAPASGTSGTGSGSPWLITRMKWIAA